MKIHDRSEPLDADNVNLAGSTFARVKLAGASFTDVDLSRSAFTDVSLRDATFTDVNLSGATITKANLAGMTINGIPVLELLQVYRAAHTDQPNGAIEEASSPEVIEIKTFVPAKDFSLSKQFYQDIGFTMKSEGGGVAYFCFEHASFLLQDHCDETSLPNVMMHLLVNDVDAWWSRIDRSGVVDKYAVSIKPIQLQPWRMRDFCLTDPTGVVWRIAQNVA